MNSKELKETRKKHVKAIKDFYTKHGVGSTLKQKYAFWESHFGPCGFSHNPTLKTMVSIQEQVWLHDEYPQDF